jgi:hypothetical protein
VYLLYLRPKAANHVPDPVQLTRKYLFTVPVTVLTSLPAAVSFVIATNVSQVSPSALSWKVTVKSEEIAVQMT